MLEVLSKGFRQAKTLLTGKATLTEDNIQEAVREIRVSLLEADVELNVVRTFLERVKQRAVGEVVPMSVQQGKKNLNAGPGEHFVLICQHELEKLMGPLEETPLIFHRPFTVIMMVGLQGTGKTTTCAKLAQYLIDKRRRPMMVAADIYRPAAVEQLQILGERLDVPVFARPDLSPPQLCEDALREARKRRKDVILFDTAGRLAIDDEMMVELEDIKRRTKPHHILLVCDAMAGQDTVRTASEFNRRLDLTGFIMTKLDGDARGGAALSIKEVTGKPIKFLGVGEGLDKLEAFRPEGLASRILGMGDIVGLMRDFESVVDEKEAERDTKKLLRGQFTLDDFLKQISLLQQVGSVQEIYEKFPLFGDAAPAGFQLDDKTFVVMKSLIQSMTPAERRTPKIIDKGRAARIAKGSGRKPEQVVDLVNRFSMMHQMMAQLTQDPGLLGALPGFKQLSQIRKLKGLGMKDVMGDAKELRALAGRGPMGGFAPPGMPGLPGMGMPTMRMPGGIPAGFAPPGYPQAAPAAAPRDKLKSKAKRKEQKKARKQSRKH